MNICVRLLCAIILFCGLDLSIAANLHPGFALYPGQGVYSDDGRYLLLMQGDGNLVYYRTIDRAVRWASYTNFTAGYVATMQGDGNLVVYNSGWGAVWNSVTHNHPGAYLSAQNDGNLVIYWNGQALWNIGQDPDLIKAEPRQEGDIVGRTLASFVSFPGHVGYYDGKNVYQVMNENPVVQYVTVENFKAKVAYQGPSAYWGAGYPNIPHFFVKGCFETNCRNNPGRVLHSRNAMSMRAYQIWQIGARYTLSSQASPTLPEDATHRVTVGSYRCDTYLLDIYKIFNAGGETDIRGNPAQSPANSAYGRWIFFLNADLSGAILPTVMFDKLKHFRG